jgi:hypothetical protein
MEKFLTPQVRTFIYGAVAALLSVATVQGWVSDDLAKSVQDNLPTIIGAISSIIAAANVRPAKPPVAPTVPDRIEPVTPVHGNPPDPQ